MPVRFGLQVQTMPRQLTSVPPHPYAPRVLIGTSTLRIDTGPSAVGRKWGGSRLEGSCDGFGSYPSMSGGGCHVRTENPSAGSSANDGWRAAHQLESLSIQLDLLPEGPRPIAVD